MFDLLQQYNPLSIDYMRFLRMAQLRWRAARLSAPHPYNVPIRVEGIVSISDLDELGHQNNLRYAREAELCRMYYLMATQLWLGIRKCSAQALKQKKKPAFVVGATLQRFRKELLLGNHYTTTCKVICWSGRSIIVEQTLISNGVVCYLLLIEQVVLGYTADDLMKTVTSDASPPTPKYIEQWLASVEQQKQSIPRTAADVKQYLAPAAAKQSTGQLSKL